MKPESWKDVFENMDISRKRANSFTVRELVTVVAAEIDIALAEVLAQRVRGPVKIVSDFFGITGRHDSPGGSFSSRIDMARLTGLINEDDHCVLHALRDLRNRVAHRVKIETGDIHFQTFIEKLNKSYFVAGTQRYPNETTEQYFRDVLSTVLTIFQSQFLEVLKVMTKIESIRPTTS